MTVAVAAVLAGELLPTGAPKGLDGHTAPVALTGPPLRLAGFTVPTPVHSTPTAKPCGLRVTVVHAVAAGASRCVQVDVSTVEYVALPPHSRAVTVGDHKAFLEVRIGSPYTRVTVVMPGPHGSSRSAGTQGFVLVRLSGRSLSSRDLLTMAARLVDSQCHNQPRTEEAQPCPPVAYGPSRAAESP